MKTQVAVYIRRWLTAGVLLCFTGTAVAQKASGIGTITEIGLAEEYVYINDTEFGFAINNLQVILQDNPVRTSTLQDGLIVRYETEDDGYTIARITILGPKSRIDEYFSR